MKSKKFNLTTDKILSISAIIIAVVSIVVSVWDSSEVRRHNRLSVRPQLEIKYSRSQANFGYYVTNNGLGPAMIKGNKIYIDGVEIKPKGFGGFDSFLEKLELKNRKFVSKSIGEGVSLQAGQRENIIMMNILETDDVDSLLPAVYNRVGIEITYQSMYEETFFCSINR